MPSIRAEQNFKRKAKKWVSHDSERRVILKSILSQLIENPFHPRLKTHKVIARHDNKQAFSSRVTGDTRIIWRGHHDHFDVLDILDLGGHEGKNKVY